MYTRAVIFVAFIYTVHCNPLGQTTVCESAQTLPSSTTVCESSSNFPFLPYGLPATGLGAAGLLSLLSGPLGLSGFANPALGSSTVCESTSNMPGLAGLGGLPGLGLNPLSSLYGLPLGYPYGLSNLAMPNLLGFGPLGAPLPAVPFVGAGSSTICESTPNLLGPLGLPLPLGGLGLGGLGLGRGLLI